ncbi:nicotinamide-nucleotide amidohydrolase family protein [Candidatus Poribacteria bacterium]|nr:nicotinamide-nucleotide amidohydrolase family protein [Candidatus Poribacteria bacterium]
MTSRPSVRILSTGSEIVQGLYADTNAMEMSRTLLGEGFRVVAHSAVPDGRGAITGALRAAFGQCDLLVISGGIGPTEDDLTRDLVAEVWERPLVRIHRAEAMLRERFARRGVPMPERNLRQVFVPEGSIPLLNHWGTATGFLLPPAGSLPTVIALPGVPRECFAMFGRAMEYHIRDMFPGRPRMAAHTLHLAMIPESAVNEMVHDLFGAESGLELTLLARLGHVRVRMVAAGDGPEGRLSAFAAQVRERLPGDAIFAEGPDEASLEAAVAGAFRSKGRTLALAESCTGGGVTRRITSVPGASEVLLEGIVCYSNESKVRRLDVKESTLASFGAVSGECALEMAEGALRSSGASAAVSITGIAGPSGGTAEKPVGTVWFAICSSDGTRHALHRWIPGDRDVVREWAENQALDLLRRWVAGLPLPGCGSGKMLNSDKKGLGIH